jgi:TM2 domain-containing membrane protein YozV
MAAAYRETGAGGSVARMTVPSHHPQLVGHRNKWAAVVLAVLLGGIGVHRFYLGQLGWGLLYLLFSWTFVPLLLSLIEAVGLVLTPRGKFDQVYNTRP